VRDGREKRLALGMRLSFSPLLFLSEPVTTQVNSPLRALGVGQPQGVAAA